MLLMLLLDNEMVLMVTPMMVLLLLQVAQMLLDGKDLKFYQYNGDVNELLDGVRASLNELAEHWTREQKDHCLKETADAFQVSKKSVAGQHSELQAPMLICYHSCATHQAV
jgi:hypothetical protein